MTTFILAAGAAFILVGALIPVLQRVALVDVPNHRSSHTAPVPRSGGIAVMAALAVSLLLADTFDAWTLVLAAAALAAVGLIDDFASLSGIVRLISQTLAAAWVALWILQSAVPGGSWWMLPMMLVLLVGYVNAFNFMDGVNGISSLTALVTGVFWTIVGARHGLESIELLGSVLAGSALGFLPWNAPKARVFLGDVGSYGLGLLIGSLSVLAWALGVHWLLVLAPLLVYGADTAWVLAKRARGGRALMEAHREHAYQRLVDGGWTHLASAGLCALTGAVVCIVAALTWRSVPELGLVIALVAVLGYLTAPRYVLAERSRAS